MALETTRRKALAEETPPGGDGCVEGDEGGRSGGAEGEGDAAAGVEAGFEGVEDGGVV